jgi:hypothetical protein
MSILGDHFPLKNRTALATRSIRPRSIIKLFHKGGRPPKDKRFVVIGETTSEIGCLIINSEINEKCYPPGTDRYSLQIELIHSAECNYLDRNSFADCTFIYLWNKEDTMQIISENTERALGTISEDHWILIIKALQRNTTTIGNKIKRKFGII